MEFGKYTKEQVAAAAQAEARGRAVPGTSEAYLDLFRSRGPGGVTEALIARNGTRWANLNALARELCAHSLPALSRVPLLSSALRAVRAKENLRPADWGGSWPRHLHWALDSAASAVRLLLLGQGLGAASIARGQLERWTENLRFFRQLGADASFRTVWEVHGTLPIEPITAYDEMSELLHGRGPLMELVRWEAEDQARGVLPKRAVAVISATLELALLQVRAGVYSHVAPLPGGQQLCRALTDANDRLDSSRSYVPFLYLVPLFPCRLDISEWVDGQRILERYRDVQDKSLRWCVKKPDVANEFTVVHFLSHRQRARNWCKIAYRKETELTGNRDLSIVDTREYWLIVATEAAFLASKWLSNHPGADSLTVAGAALKSGHFLWLEDDERCLQLARSALEALARSHAWRHKPERARAVDDTGPASGPARWLEVAGWRRLSVLNRALGEFSHMKLRERFDGARRVLAVLTDDGRDSASLPSFRGDVLSLLLAMLVDETCQWLNSAGIGTKDQWMAAIRKRSSMIGTSDWEELLQRSLRERDATFGAPSWRRVEEIH